MRELSYTLRFTRAHKGAPTRAGGLVTVSSLGGNSAPVETHQVELGGEARYVSEYSVDPDGVRFMEHGTITFGATPEHTLAFSTIAHGYLRPPADPATNLTPGIVMWQIDSGTGFFAGATGVIASSFRVDLESERLIDDHLATIRLPDEVSA
jgi:hypothetical protein